MKNVESAATAFIKKDKIRFSDNTCNIARYGTLSIVMDVIRKTLLSIAAFTAATAGAADFGHGPLNRPYSDGRAWHLGFSVGVHAQDLSLTHSGYVTDDGRTWFMDQPSYSPGFCVSGLIDMRLNDYFNLRIAPGLWLGNREIKMLDTTTGDEQKQNMKSTFVVVPVDIKFSSVRYLNSRPYITAGIMPAVDVAKKRNDFIKLKPADIYLTMGLGCDFYLPYFKLNPEIRFCLGLTDVLQRRRPDLADDPQRMDITRSLLKARSKMIVLTFYFE